MDKITIKKEFSNYRIGFGDINEELGKMTEDQLAELLKMAHKAGDLNLLDKFASGPTKKELDQVNDQKFLDKTTPVEGVAGNIPQEILDKNNPK